MQMDERILAEGCREGDGAARRELYDRFAGRLMAVCMRYAGDRATAEDLLHDAWGWEFITETKTVDTHIKRLRDKIEAAGYDPKLVETVRGYGYRFKK